MKVLVTGVNGFVGRAVWRHISSIDGLDVSGSVRLTASSRKLEPSVVSVGDLSSRTDWSRALASAWAVVHTAARVHVMDDAASDPLDEFRRVNVLGTLNLARQAAASGVRRFVLISSIKVNGESTQVGLPFTETNEPLPLDPYGISKNEAELGLREIAMKTGMEVVIIRPPLVYGPGVKANFATLVRAIKKGWPLPLGGLHNNRSLVALDNLVDFILTCVLHPNAANQTFLVSDGQDLSTSELVRGLAKWSDRPARLFPLPGWMMRVAGAAIGKRAAVQRLTGNLQVDISKAQELLGWVPPISVDEGLRRVMLDVEKR